MIRKKLLQIEKVWVIESSMIGKFVITELDFNERVLNTAKSCIVEMKAHVHNDKVKYGGKTKLKTFHYVQQFYNKRL